MELEEEILIEAPPERVWERLVDLERAHELVGFIQRAEVTDGAMRQGATARVQLHYMGFGTETDAVVTEFEPARALALRADVPSAHITATVAWRLTPEGAGTRVSQRIGVTYGSMLTRLAAKSFIGDSVSEHAAREGLAQLKAAVEGTEASA